MVEVDHCSNTAETVGVPLLAVELNVLCNGGVRMSFFEEIEKELQKKLIEFVNDSKNNKVPKKFSISLAEELLKNIVNGDREISGIATDWGSGDVFCIFSFTEEAREEYMQNRKKSRK